MKGVVETKTSWPPKENESKGSSNKSKGQASKIKRYIDKKALTKTQGPDLKANTDFKGQCSDLEGYIFDLGLRNSDKFSMAMK